MTFSFCGFREVPRVPQGSAGFLKDLPSGRFRKVPRGSATVPQGSAMVFLRISLAGKVPQGSAKVPQWFS